RVVADVALHGAGDGPDGVAIAVVAGQLLWHPAVLAGEVAELLALPALARLAERRLAAGVAEEAPRVGDLVAAAVERDRLALQIAHTRQRVLAGIDVTDDRLVAVEGHALDDAAVSILLDDAPFAVILVAHAHVRRRVARLTLRHVRLHERGALEARIATQAVDGERQDLVD